MTEIRVPISPGELLDKITILRIKSQRMSGAEKLKNVRLELQMLQETWDGSAYARMDVEAEVRALMAVNERLWVIEDDIRDLQANWAASAAYLRPRNR